MNAPGDWDPTRRMFVVIIGERYSPNVTVAGPFTQATGEAWKEKIAARVGALGSTWEWRIEPVTDPADFDA